MREGWQEIEFENNEKIRSCNGCKWLKHQMVKSGFNPIYQWVCLSTENIDSDWKPSILALRNGLTEDINGYVEPPGINGDMCPFNEQLEREIKLNSILPNNKL